jgi:hypothetical protein
MSSGLLTLMSVLALLGAGACNRQKKYEKWLPGEWTLARFEKQAIYPDGTVQTLTEISDAGIWKVMIDPDIGKEGPFLYFLRYDTGGTVIGDTGYVDISKEGRRIIFYGACIGCNINDNIEHFDKNDLVFSRYRPSSLPDFRYRFRFRKK